MPYKIKIIQKTFDLNHLHNYLPIHNDDPFYEYKNYKRCNDVFLVVYIFYMHDNKVLHLTLDILQGLLLDCLVNNEHGLWKQRLLLAEILRIKINPMEIILMNLVGLKTMVLSNNLLLLSLEMLIRTMSMDNSYE